MRLEQVDKRLLVEERDRSAFSSNKRFNSGNPLKIGYFADGVWSHEAFKRLINNNVISIQFICVRFDTKDETLLSFSKEYNIDYLRHENINSIEFIEDISKYNCDLFVSMSFNQIFKNVIINLPPLKTINCHAGKLPFYRGRNILNWVLINDESEFGITVHYVDEGIDTGDIILQKTYPILDSDDYKTLLKRAYIYCADILYDAILMLVNSTVKTRKQTEIHSVGFYCTQRKKGDEVLDWNQTSREIFNFVRAISSPGPIARAFLNNIEMKINKIEEVKNSLNYKCITGAILKKEESGFIVKTKDSFVKVLDFEYDGKFKVGDRFELK